MRGPLSVSEKRASVGDGHDGRTELAPSACRNA
jgi:hypothetical protein